MEELSIDYIVEMVANRDPEADIPMIKKAYLYAAIVHHGQRRKSGEPYIIHPLAVALFLVREMKITDSATIAIALMHDIVEDGEGVVPEILGRNFDSYIVEGIKMLSKDNNSGETKTEINEKYLSKITKLPREILVIKIADKIHNASTLNFFNDETKIRNYINEIKTVFLPLAWQHFPEMAKALEEIINQYPESNHPIDSEPNDNQAGGYIF